MRIHVLKLNNQIKLHSAGMRPNLIYKTVGPVPCDLLTTQWYAVTIEVSFSISYSASIPQIATYQAKGEVQNARTYTMC